MKTASLAIGGFFVVTGFLVSGVHPPAWWLGLFIIAIGIVMILVGDPYGSPQDDPLEGPDPRDSLVRR